MIRGFLIAAIVVIFARCAPSPPPLNIIILTIDTCRADRLSCYGYDLLDTPHIDSLATEGVLFEEARTCVPITLPSHVSIMTGLYPVVHGVRENGAYVAADSLLTLAEILKGNGYATAAFMGSFPLESRFNLDQGFDYYGDLFGEKDGSSKGAAGGVSIFFDERPADEVNEDFFRWLENHDKSPFFAWLHYFDPHQPHDLRPPYDATCATRPYDGEIAFVDECVGRLRKQLDKENLLERTIFVVTSDHGEGLGEHGEMTHALLLYDSTLKVPMIIRCPRTVGLAAARVTDPVRTVDLLPTILELLGLDVPPGIHGRSLVGIMSGSSGPAETHYTETFFGKLHFGWSVLAGYQSEGWKYIHGP